MISPSYKVETLELEKREIADDKIKPVNFI